MPRRVAVRLPPGTSSIDIAPALPVETSLSTSRPVWASLIWTRRPRPEPSMRLRTSSSVWAEERSTVRVLPAFLSVIEPSGPIPQLGIGPLGSITLKNAGNTRTVDLSSAQTLDDVRNLIEGSGLGLRVQINDAQTGLDVLNEVSTGKAGAMSIEEVPGGNLTATRLGIRTYAAETRLADFNDGKGVR